MTTQRTETLTMLIRWYNMMAGTRCKSGNEANQRVFNRMLNEDMSNVQEIKNHIRTWCDNNPQDKTCDRCLTKCTEAFFYGRTPQKVQEEPQVVPVAVAPQTQNVSESQVGSAMGILETGCGRAHC